MFFLSVFFTSFISLCFGKDIVFTTAFNRPDFIELQYALLNKFMQDDFEYLVFNDANTEINKKNIETICSMLGIRCINIPQEIHDLPYLQRQPNFYLPKHNPNVRNCNAVQWAWDHFIVNHPGYALLLDSDMFLIRPLSIRKILKNHPIAGVSQKTSDPHTNKNYNYLWIALMFFDIPNLPQPHTLCFNCGTLPGTDAIVDSGGYTSIYLERFKTVIQPNYLNWVHGHSFYCPYRYTDQQSSEGISPAFIISDLSKRGFTPKEIELALEKPYTIELLCDNHFLHYRAGTNYENYSTAFIQHKDTILLKFFHKILREGNE